MVPSLTCTCGRLIQISAELAGKTFLCPDCGRTLLLPAFGKAMAVPSTQQVAKSRGFEPSARPNWLPWVFVAIGLLLLAVGVTFFPRGELPPTRPEGQQPSGVNAPGSPGQAVAVAELVEAPTPEKEFQRAPAKATEPFRPFDPGPPKAKAPPSKEVAGPPLVAKTAPKATIGPPLKLEWKLKQGDQFFQDLTISQKTNFNVQGLPVTTFVSYSVLSRFTVDKVDEQNQAIVGQKVESARLLKADDLTSGLLAPAVAKLPGTSFTIHLNALREVTKFEGGASATSPNMQNLLGGQGFQTASLLDRDGWKEMAQATFFQPNVLLKAGSVWSKPMTHNWGPLGQWVGRTNLRYTGRHETTHKVGYEHQMAYVAPKGPAAGLPFQLNGSKFQPLLAAGTIFFDEAKGRTVAGEERFRVRGLLNISFLGQEVPLELEEEQHFRFEILDRMPEKR
jgi:hypothetical protein